MRIVPLASSLLGTAFATGAAAQSAVRGAVRVDSTSRPVVGAMVSVIGVGGAEPRTSATTSTGDFLIGGLGAGQVTLSFRAIGFRPLEATAILSGKDTIDIDVRLVPLAQVLTPLAVSADRPKFLSAKMETFERRRQAGFGMFYTRAELAKVETGPMSNALRLSAGLRLMVLPIGCGSGLALANNRRTSVPIVPSMWCGNQEPPMACYLDIYVDGARYWVWGDGPPPDIDQFSVRDYQGIEVYRGRNELPAEMAHGEPNCGAIVLWTRTGES